MFNKLLGLFSKHRRKDLLALAGGIHLIPENHAHQSRINFASLVAYLSGENGHQPIESSEFMDYLNSEFGLDHPLTRHDDPIGNLFTHNIIFHGGNFIVYPGIDDGGGLRLQSLLKAVFLAPPAEDAALTSELMQPTMALLMLSNAIAYRLGHSRNMKVAGIPADQLPHIPTDKGTAYSEAVIFKDADLDRILSARGLNRSHLEPFVFRDAVDQEISYSPDLNPLVSRPLVEIKDGLLVAIPTTLSFAIRTYIWGRLKEGEAQRERYANRLADVELHEIFEFLRIADYHPFKEVEYTTEGQLRELVFRVDTDKLVLFHSVIGEATYGPNGVTDVACSTWLDERRALIHGQWGDRYKLLNLVVFVNSGIESIFAFNEPQEINLPTLMTSTIDLWLCLAQGIPDRLDFWKFCRLKAETEKKAEIFSFGSFVDEYAIYLSKRRSFYLGDEANPTHIFLAPGNEEYLQENAIVIPDIHLAYLPSTKHLKEVRRIGQDDIPIYAAKPYNGRPRHLVEFKDLAIWVSFGEASYTETPYTPHELIKCFSFWVLQVCKEVSTLSEVRPRTIEIDVVVHESIEETERALGDADVFRIKSDSSTQEEILVERCQSGIVRIHLSSDCMPLVIAEGNPLDRLVVEAVYRALWLLLIDPAQGHEAPPDLCEVLGRLVADPNRKMLLALDASKRRGLDPRNLADLRKLDDHDIDEQLTELVFKLKCEGYSKSEIVDKSEKIKLANFVVKTFANHALEIVRHLDPILTLKRLLALHEAAINAQVFDKQTGKFSRACYSDNGSYIEKSIRDGQRLTLTALAIRCMIEMVAAQPGAGSPPSDEQIDILVAQADLIVNWGRLSDEINYDLIEHHLAILGNGRVGRKESDLKPHDRFYREKYREEIAIEQQQDELSKGERQILELLQSNEGQIALRAEWGATYVETYHLSEALFEIAINYPDSVACLSVVSLIKQIKEFGIQGDDTELLSLLNQFSQIRRSGLMKPPDGYERSDIYPWRYNRQLSLMRRPLIPFEMKGESVVMFGARTVARCVETLLQNLSEGVVACRTAEMRSLQGRINRIKGSAFNQRCKEWFEINTDLRIWSNVLIGPEQRIESSQNLGDVDLLVVDSKNKMLYSIECKDISFAREPHQMQSEWGDFDDTKEDSWSAKHARRGEFLSTWIKNQTDSEFGDLSDFTVKSSILASSELPTVHLKNLSLEIISFVKLREEGSSLLRSAGSR